MSIAHVIAVTSSVAIAGILANAAFGMHDDVSAARETRADIDGARLLTEIGGAAYSFDPATGDLTITVRNEGRVPLDPGALALVMDGDLVTAAYTATVSGAAGSAIWLPGEDLVLAFTGQDGVPSRLLVASERGVANFTVLPVGPIAHVVLSPRDVDVVAGETQAFDARAFDANWIRVRSAAFTWTTDAGSIASTDDDSALLTASTTAASGRSVTATVGAVSGSAVVDVVAGALDHVTVEPTPRTLEVGSTRVFTATGRDQHGNAIDGLTFAWGGTAGALAPGGDTTTATLTAGTVAGSGFTVTATASGLTATADITLSPGPPVELAILPDLASIVAGATQQFTASYVDQYGNPNSTASAEWSTTGGAIDADGLFTAQTLAATARTVTATVGETSDTLTFDVVPDALDRIALTPATRTVQVGATQAFSAIGYDQHDNAISGLAFAWGGTAGALAPSGDTSTATLTAGTVSGSGFTVTATASGVTGTATVTLSPGPPATVAVAPTPVDVAAGASQAFTATVRDAHGNANATTTVSWASTAGPIDATGTLSAQTLAANGLSVTATANGVSGQAVVNVVPGPVSRVVVTPASATLLVNAAQSFSAVAYDQYDNIVMSASISWSATRGAVTGSGAYTAPATPGAVTVTATASGVSGTASVSVYSYTYASATFTNVAGGTVANAGSITAADGAVATLSESRTDTAVTMPSATNDRTFASSPVSGWTSTPVTGSFTLDQTASDGSPSANGALRVTKVNPGGGAAGTTNVEYAWTQSASDSVTGATIAFDYKLTGAVDTSNRYLDVFLVKPDGSTVQLGTRKTDAGNAWRSFAAVAIPASDLTASGTYKIRFVVGLKGADDQALFDNVQASWTTHTAYRFGKQLTVPSLPTGSLTYTLEVSYRVSAGSEALDLQTEGPSSTWTSRASLSSTSFATFTRTLTASEIVAGAVNLRLVDVTTSSDAALGQWEIDYVRVRAE